MEKRETDLMTISDRNHETGPNNIYLADKFAHSLKDRPIEAWQPLHSHLKQVASLAAEFCVEFDSADWGWNAGMLHDIGKASKVFQAYLRRENQMDDETIANNHASKGGRI